MISKLTGILAAGMMMISTYAMAAPKVLYVTHEPGRWHAYTPQLAAFREVATKAGWELTVSTGTYEEQLINLRKPDYAKDFDVIAYNFCFAGSNDLEALSNLMAQTREGGVPAMLIHCSMHSWWGTYKNGKAEIPNYSGKAKADPKLIEEWTKANPGKPFPVWGDFTGVASVSHGPKQPIALTKVADHAACNSLPEGYSTPNTELYNNYYVVDAVKPLVKGTQGKAESIVMWLCPQGKSQVLGLSVGHGVEEWGTPEFRNLVTDSVNFLATNPTFKK